MPSQDLSCPICTQSNAKHMHENRFAPINKFNLSYSIVECENCGHCYANVIPPNEIYTGYYETLSKYDTGARITPIDQARNQHALYLFKKLQIPKDINILDVGCGSGSFIAELHKNGYENVIGLDPAPQARQQFINQFNLDFVRRGDVSTAFDEVNPHSINLICLLAVLEHLPNMRNDFGNMISKILPGTLILIEVPAAELFDGEHGEPFGEFSLEHIQYFTKVSLHNFLKTFGIEAQHTELISLPSIRSGALYCLAQYKGKRENTERDNSGWIDKYIQASSRKQITALTHVPEEPFIIYGAGSHTARILAHFTEKQQHHIISIHDGNPNLQGQVIGRWKISPPELLKYSNPYPILVSSFRSQASIGNMLTVNYPQHRLVNIYDANQSS